MADKPKLDRYFLIVKKINAGLTPSNEDMDFFMETTPDIDQDVINAYVEEQNRANKDPKNPVANADILRSGVTEVLKIMQSDPVFKERLAKQYATADGAKISDKLSKGINIILGGTDIANSINQIQASKAQAAKSKKPGRPSVPQRDALLTQALRQSQEGTFDQERAIAPVRAEIADQYQNDIQNAKTASTGQAGAYGAYAQVAANRRNRAALDLAPIQDNIKAREQSRYDNLLGMRANETQNKFQNEGYLYKTDLDQFGKEQEANASLGSTGRLNLRDSLQNFGGQLAQGAGNYYAEQRYKKLRHQAEQSKMNPDLAEKVYKNVDTYTGYYRKPTEFFNDSQSVYDAFNKYQ